MTVRGPRRPEKALTSQFVRTVKAPGKHFDGNGLYLRVQENGSRQWVQRIVIRGRRRELGLGSPSLVPLAKARDVALENRRIAQSGGDPLAKRKRESAVLNFEEASRRAHAELLPTWKNPRDQMAFISTLEAYVFPRFGGQLVSEVTPADVRQAILAIRSVAPEVARKLVFRIAAVFRWSIAEGMRSDNPAKADVLALPRLDRTPVHRKSLPYTEVAACLDAVKCSGASGATKLAMELLVLTATRSGEVRGAHRNEFNLERDPVWLIPANRMKMKRAHRVPLSLKAVTVIKEAFALDDGSGLLFPSGRVGRPLSDMTLSKLVKDLGFDADVHGFRTSFRTWAQEQTNFPREVAEAALAHGLRDKAEAAYARSDLFEKRRKMMDAWAGYLAARPGEVLPLTNSHSQRI